MAKKIMTKKRTLKSKKISGKKRVVKKARK